MSESAKSSEFSAVAHAGQAVPTAAASHVVSGHHSCSRVDDLMDQFDIGDMDELKHALEDYRRWSKDVPSMSADLAALRQEQERFELRRADWALEYSKLADKLDAAEQRAASLHSTLAALPQEIDQVIHAIPFGFAESAHTAVEHIRGRLRSFWREKGL